MDKVEYLTLWQKLNDFVLETCHDRDESHGYKHMLIVAKNSLLIYTNSLFDNERMSNNILKYIIIVSWLHDIADHKYDKDGTLKNKLKDFIDTINDVDTNLVLNIIDHISYSKENKAILSGNPINYGRVLGNFGVIVRDIVSDADKLEALGKIGFDRCVEYIKHTNNKINGTDLKNEVIKHANEKLFRLKDEFIRTEYGKKLALSLHKELILEINKMQ